MKRILLSVLLLIIAGCSDITGSGNSLSRDEAGELWNVVYFHSLMRLSLGSEAETIVEALDDSTGESYSKVILDLPKSCGIASGGTRITAEVTSSEVKGSLSFEVCNISPFENNWILVTNYQDQGISWKERSHLLWAGSEFVREYAIEVRGVVEWASQNGRNGRCSVEYLYRVSSRGMDISGLVCGYRFTNPTNDRLLVIGS
ncbi:MAG: hypothetical protein LBG44_00540 [Gemmatimonadota bacterium]|nr:hypothetical protein [Gemmatimonadota bacterium]